MIETSEFRGGVAIARDLSELYLEPREKNTLIVIYSVLIILYYLIPLNLFDGNHNGLNGIGFVFYWIMDYYRKMQTNDFVERQIAKFSIWKEWKALLITIGLLGILFYFVEGELWQGFAFGAILCVGILINNKITSLLVRRFIRFEGS